MDWKGTAYPMIIGERGIFKEATDAELIKGNILQIIGTRRGERVMLPLFGSRLLEFVHEPLDHITCALMRFELIQAISMWEPRVVLNKERTTVTPYSGEFKVVAHMKYHLISRVDIYDYSVEINRNGGVSEWLRD